MCQPGYFDCFSTFEQPLDEMIDISEYSYCVEDNKDLKDLYPDESLYAKEMTD